jgi:hypothetical protein
MIHPLFAHTKLIGELFNHLAHCCFLQPFRAPALRLGFFAIRVRNRFRGLFLAIEEVDFGSNEFRL